MLFIIFLWQKHCFLFCKSFPLIKHNLKIQIIFFVDNIFVINIFLFLFTWRYKALSNVCWEMMSIFFLWFFSEHVASTWNKKFIFNLFWGFIHNNFNGACCHLLRRIPHETVIKYTFIFKSTIQWIKLLN